MTRVLAAMFALILMAAAAAATQEQIGTWVLRCPNDAGGSDACQLQARKRFVDKAGIVGDLEVLADGKSLIPVLALHGLPKEVLMAAAMAGKTEASMQFAGSPAEALDCAPSSAGYVCSPHGDAARHLAASLPAARSVTVRVELSVPGLKPLPAQERSLDLTDTAEALTKLRAAHPAALPDPFAAAPSQAQSATGLMAVADKVLKSAGYPNGLADLERLIARYRGK